MLTDNEFQHLLKLMNETDSDGQLILYPPQNDKSEPVAIYARTVKTLQHTQ